MDKKYTHPIDVHVGFRVRARRVLLKMSQEALGKELGLTFQQIQKYEKGQNRISAGRLWRIAGLLDVPVSYFYEGIALSPRGMGFSESVKESVEEVGRFSHSADGVRLMRAFIRIKDERVRRSLVNLVLNIAMRQGEESLEVEGMSSEIPADGEEDRHRCVSDSV